MLTRQCHIMSYFPVLMHINSAEKQICITFDHLSLPGLAPPCKYCNRNPIIKNDFPVCHHSALNPKVTKSPKLNKE